MQEGGNIITEKKKEDVEQVMEGYRVGYAYLYPMEGIKRQEYVFNMTPENIANFIGSHLYDMQKVVLTDMMDRLILDTVGGFIDNCPNQELCMQVIAVLAPIQMGDSEPEEFPIVTREQYDEYCQLEEEAVMRAEITML